MLFGPLVILVLFSFNDSNVLAIPLEGVTTKWYTEALTDPVLRTALKNSFQVAFVVAPLCPARHLRFGSRFRFRGRVIGGLVGAPLVLPWLIISIAALMGYARADIGSKTVDPDGLHVPPRDGDRGRTAIPFPEGAGGGRDRPRMLAPSGAAAHHPAAHRPGAGGRRHLRVRVVVQQLRDQRVHARLPERSRCGCTRTCATPDLLPRS
jgi:hypothetical protein